MVAQVVAGVNTHRVLRLVALEILPLLVLLKEIQVVEEQVEDQLVVVELELREHKDPDLQALVALVVQDFHQKFQDPQ